MRRNNIRRRQCGVCSSLESIREERALLSKRLRSRHALAENTLANEAFNCKSKDKPRPADIASFVRSCTYMVCERAPVRRCLVRGHRKHLRNEIISVMAKVNEVLHRAASNEQLVYILCQRTNSSLIFCRFVEFRTLF